MTRAEAEKWLKGPCPGGPGHEQDGTSDCRWARHDCFACVLDALAPESGGPHGKVLACSVCGWSAEPCTHIGGWIERRGPVNEREEPSSPSSAQGDLYAAQGLVDRAGALIDKHAKENGVTFAGRERLDVRQVGPGIGGVNLPSASSAQEDGCQHPLPHYIFPPGTKYEGRLQCVTCGGLIQLPSLAGGGA